MRNGGGALPTVTATQGKAPTVKVPTSSPPSSLVVKTLIKGSGAPLAKGEYVVTQYVGLNWRTRAVFDSSWSRGAPLGFQLDASPEQIIPGWDKGLVGVPVIAVPTSVGYGASFKGLTALLGMLNSCASNVSVVNIDNGFGAGYVASLINRL